MDAVCPNSLGVVKRLVLGATSQYFCGSLVDVTGQKSTSEEIKEINQRMRKTREALGYFNLSDYARKAGIGPKTYTNYEHGFPVGLDGAIKLCKAYHLSLDWIYFGEERALLSMPSAIADKIRAYYSNPPAISAKPKRGRRPFRKAS